jgi:hypothetical protein
MLFLVCYAAAMLIWWGIKAILGEAKFAWYDLWIGIYVDRKRRRTYVCTLPCFVIWDDW